MKIPSDIVESNRQMPPSFYPREGDDDRVEVIRATAEIESLALEALKKVVLFSNSRLQTDQVKVAMSDAGYNDETSLKRLAKVLYMLGRIDRDLRDDLCALYKIRTVYAHRARAKQLDEEPDIQAMVVAMECYKQTRAELNGLPSVRHRYRAIAAHLKRELVQIAS